MLHLDLLAAATLALTLAFGLRGWPAASCRRTVIEQPVPGTCPISRPGPDLGREGEHPPRPLFPRWLRRACRFPRCPGRGGCVGVDRLFREPGPAL